MKRSLIERIWTVASALLVIIAAFFFWRNNFSAAFVTAALGAVAWFLGYRARVRGQLAARESPNEDDVSRDADEN